MKKKDITQIQSELLNFGIAPQVVSKLKKLGIETLQDLIFHLPFRYEDYSKIVKINKVKNDQNVTLKGKILQIGTRRTFRKKMLLTEAIISDNTGALKVVWFNQPFLTKSFKKNTSVSLAGKITLDERGDFIMSNPIIEIEGKNVQTGRIVPVYPETYGLTSKWFRQKIQSLRSYIENIGDYFPDEILKKFSLLPLPEALLKIHFPKNFQEIEKAKERLIFEQIFPIQLKVLIEKKIQENERAMVLKIEEHKINEILNSLDFKLTDDQLKALKDILADLKKGYPMNRLLEGDVGTGKTLVAILSSWLVALKGFQTAILAPTETLAIQHFENFHKIIKDNFINIALLTSSFSKLSHAQEGLIFAGSKTISTLGKDSLINKIKDGGIQIVIGTHSLIEQKVNFNNLALVVVDEQHRFGVRQRSYLLINSYRKNSCQKIRPHLLSMTATPIPRTLALTLYSNLSLSILSQFPMGKREVLTKVVPQAKRKKMYDFIKKEIGKGAQVFFVCPLIEESEILQSKAATTEFNKLKKIFKGIEIGLVHGRLKAAEKNKIIKDFEHGKLKILVATPVIEVGIDVPNASIMVIEGAERFGLAQIHQLRGRVGRKGQKSYCFLLTDSTAKNTHRRLAALEKINDGFKLAEIDLRIRGPGQFIGVMQSGEADLAMENLDNIALIKKSIEVARYISEIDPELQKFPLLREKILQFNQRAHLE